MLQDRTVCCSESSCPLPYTSCPRTKDGISEATTEQWTPTHPQLLSHPTYPWLLPPALLLQDRSGKNIHPTPYPSQKYTEDSLGLFQFHFMPGCLVCMADQIIGQPSLDISPIHTLLITAEVGTAWLWPVETRVRIIFSSGTILTLTIFGTKECMDTGVRSPHAQAHMCVRVWRKEGDSRYGKYRFYKPYWCCYWCPETEIRVINCTREYIPPEDGVNSSLQNA